MGSERTPGNSEQITVYPNPVKDILQIDYQNISDAELQVCDMAGRVLIRQPLSHSIDMKGLASGSYMLKVQTAQQAVIVKMLMKE